jgi:HNH endonuclease
MPKPNWTNDPYQLPWRKSNGPRIPKTLLERFEAKLLPGVAPPDGLPGDCWEWGAAHFQQTGYALLCIKSSDSKWRPTVAHRIAYELFIADIPPGLVIDHLCRNRGCVNPWHMEPVTHAVNNLRGLIAAGLIPRDPETLQAAQLMHWSVPGWDGRCHNGHLITPETTYTRSDGRRECLICIRNRDNARNRNRKEYYHQRYLRQKQQAEEVIQARGRTAHADGASRA